MNNEQLNIDRLINSVGTETFIKYFFEFKTFIRLELINLFESNNEPWNENSKGQKASNGKRIFNEVRELEALEHIILKKKEHKIPNGSWVKKRAEEIYYEYNPSNETLIEKESITAIEKKVLTKYRLQQSKFRKKLLLYWKECSVTGCRNSQLLIASHIKPYSECNIDEKYDLYNGLLLTPSFDRLFDNNLISFDNNGKVILSESIDLDDLKCLNITGAEMLNMEKVTKSTLEYLKYHRQKFESKEKAD